jgi:phosphoribosylformylglycinamidine cyclo-ligase
MVELTYKDAGVDTAEGARAVDAIRDAVRSTYRDEVVGDIGGFGGLFSAAALKDMDEPLLVSGTDGVGTKLALAQRFDRHDGVGIDLVAMCANDILACGAEPLFFLDYVAVGKLDSGSMARIVGGIAEGCRRAGCALVGGEMAEHPGVMDADDYDLSGFCVGVVDRKDMIGPQLVREGDVILGLASTGIHSNGYSLVRRAITDKASEDYMTRKRDELGKRSLIDALLEPTRIYVKSVRSVLAAGLPIHALAHITGGGITENLDRALPEGLDAAIQLGTWDIPSVITFVSKAAELSQEQALKTFNMGIGMAVMCDEADVDAITSVLEDNGERIWRIGVIEKSAQGARAKGQVVYR